LAQEISGINAELANASIDAYFLLQSDLPKRLSVQLSLGEKRVEVFVEATGDGKHFTCTGALKVSFQCNALHGLLADPDRAGGALDPVTLARRILSTLARDKPEQSYEHPQKE
jgi:hypothetical protein